MSRVTLARQCSDDTPHAGARRERASTDLREHGPALIAAAQSAHMSVSALMRTILAEWLSTHAAAGSGARDFRRVDTVSRRKRAPCITVKLSIPVDAASLLARRAQAAELFRGQYVARLIDGQLPVPVTPDRREDRDALLRSTATLAAMSSDLHALMRALRHSSSPAQVVCNATVAQLSAVVLQHLVAVAPLVAALTPARRPPAVDPF